MSRFYNPGPAINELLAFTNITIDPRDANNLSQYSLHAKEKDFFEVPDVLTIQAVDGEAQIPVSFAKVLKMQKAEQGVILINPKAEDIREADNVAANDADAKRKGDLIQFDYLRAKCTEWYAIVAQTKASGGIPAPATGLFSAALKRCHLKDPADTVDAILTAQAGQVTNDETQKQMAAMQSKIDQLIGAMSVKAGK